MIKSSAAIKASQGIQWKPLLIQNKLAGLTVVTTSTTRDVLTVPWASKALAWTWNAVSFDSQDGSTRGSKMPWCTVDPSSRKLTLKLVDIGECRAHVLQESGGSFTAHSACAVHQHPAVAQLASICLQPGWQVSKLAELRVHQLRSLLQTPVFLHNVSALDMVHYMLMYQCYHAVLLGGEMTK